MEVLTDFSLEEFSPENKCHFYGYSDSFEDFETSWFCEPALMDFNARARFYAQNRSIGLDQDCRKLNTLLQARNKQFLSINRPCQIYYMIRKNDYQAVGMVQIYCGHCLNNNTFVPEVIYEVSPTERGKKYSKFMLHLLLQHNSISAEYFYFNISNRNSASNGLIHSFKAEEVAIDHRLEAKTYRLRRK